MHAPDGFLNAGTAVGTGVISGGTLAYCLRQARDWVVDKQIPLAGVCAAFIFAAQMFNFPVAGGTTGHLLGGALAAVLLGPLMGILVLTVVVAVQALAFADGGLTALGYNILNMGIVTSLGGYAIFMLSRRFLPANGTGVITATGLAALGSVIISSMAFSVEWLFGATAPVSFETVFGAMVGVHALIGVGEAVISALAVGAVLASRPDLVYGARDLDRAALAERSGVSVRGFAAGGTAVALVFGAIVSQFAFSSPDGLISVAEQTGFISQEQTHAFSEFLFSGYATQGIGNEVLSLAIAGVSGVLVTLGLAAGLFYITREARQRRRGQAAGHGQPVEPG
jgi:cobalt/nickel transport system permease protein